MSSRKAVLIPVKDPSRGKSRLSGVLSPAERERLIWCMFEDVRNAVSDCAVPDLVAVVTNHEPVASAVRSLGWEVIEEDSQSSESESVDWASRLLAARGVDLVLRLPADLPLLRPEDVDELLLIDLDPPGALAVASRDGTGTNALLRTPPALFPSRFGPDSLRLHFEEARKADAPLRVVENPRISLDIDDAADLEVLLERGKGTISFDAVQGMNLGPRLGIRR